MYKRALVSLLAVNLAILAAWFVFVQLKSGFVLLNYAVAMIILGISAASLALLIKNKGRGYITSSIAAVLSLVWHGIVMFSVGSLHCCQLESSSLSLAGIVVALALLVISWSGRGYPNVNV